MKMKAYHLTLFFHITYVSDHYALTKYNIWIIFFLQVYPELIKSCYLYEIRVLLFVPFQLKSLEV